MSEKQSLESSAQALVSLMSSKPATPVKMSSGGVVGESTTSSPVPQRELRKNRKRNRFYSDDDDYIPPTAREYNRREPVGKRISRDAATMASPLKSESLRAISSASANTLSTIEKKAAQKIGLKLRDLLKLPKAYKWVIYEWFYSNIDRVLFEGENDFSICLKETFPNLTSRMKTRTEWGFIRQLMGKPRRCSSSFFAEEREALKLKRLKIRMLQQRQVTQSADLTQFKDLPDEIPLPLVIGTKCTAYLRNSDERQDSLYTGQIEAVDTVSSAYRVKFDRTGLGAHTIPDVDVVSRDEQETMAIATFIDKQRMRFPIYTPPRRANNDQSTDDPMLGSAQRDTLEDEGYLGGYPVKFLKDLSRLTKILNVKRQSINQLRDLNTRAERLKSYHEDITFDFQKTYANIILDLEQLNKELNKYLTAVQNHCQEIAPDHGLLPINQPCEIRQACEDDAKIIVHKQNTSSSGKTTIKNSRILDLTCQLTSIMMQIKSLAESDSINSYELKSLTDTINDIKNKIEPRNARSFQNNVEIHVLHIQSGLSRVGNLHAFHSSQDDK